jgi:predicted metalloendopeptidase
VSTSLFLSFIPSIVI